MRPCVKCGSTRRSRPYRGRTGVCLDCAAKAMEMKRRAKGVPPRQAITETCPRCGALRRGRPDRGAKFGDCLECKKRWRKNTPESRAAPSQWRGYGWCSRAELIHGIKTARAATACEGCRRVDSGRSSTGFCADHSDARHGGSGRFRGVLCLYCNTALGYHERRGWPLAPWLAEYIARAAVRPLLEQDEEQLTLPIEVD